MINKKDEFSPELVQVAAFNKALSHPARIAILQAIAKKNTCICGEIVDIMPIAQSTVSQHLKVLKEANLIHGEIAGAASCYCLNYEILKKQLTLLNSLLAFAEKFCITNKNC